MDQHVLSRWLLKAFAGNGPSGRAIVIFDKRTGEFSSDTPDHFMTELDAHSPQVEYGIAQIEGPASSAALGLAKRAKNQPAGLYAIVGPEQGAVWSGPAVVDEGEFQGVRLLVGNHQIPWPRPGDREALGRYVGLMYQRAPKSETAILRWGLQFDVGAQAALDRLVPGMQSGLRTEIAKRRERMLGIADNIGAQLASASWWVARAEPGEGFVLSDTPVAATTSIGVDDQWRAIFETGAFAVVMPISPVLALVIAPKGIFPVSGIDLTMAGLTSALNRMMWRAADRYVVGRSRSDLERAWPDAEGRREVQPVGLDIAGARATGDQTVTGILNRLPMRLYLAQPWPRWVGCRLDFGDTTWLDS